MRGGRHLHCVPARFEAKSIQQPFTKLSLLLGLSHATASPHRHAGAQQAGSGCRIYQLFRVTVAGGAPHLWCFSVPSLATVPPHSVKCTCNGGGVARAVAQAHSQTHEPRVTDADHSPS